ncbi:MAG: LytTR family DNA-binding domain-containing protein [Bacteroidota bacterium]|nr:LytTR family DNA-binding domain-containing protein [Bacteroidota bacterium]
MKVLLIEDEAAAVTRMRKMLVEIDPSIEIVGDVPSVKSAVDWFGENEAPDLAFFDVQLADGESFEIFNQVQVECPVIFTTAYDEYALKAFRVNALDYLLKPIKKQELLEAVTRVRSSGVVRDHSALSDHKDPVRPNVLVKRFLIRYGDHFKLVEPQQIAYIHSMQKNTFLRTMEGRDLPLEESLDRLELQLDPEKFFRLNRQVLVHLQSIKELLAYSKSRVKVMLHPPYNDDAIVSSERSADFKRWLSGN